MKKEIFLEEPEDKEYESVEQSDLLTAMELDSEGPAAELC